MDSKQWESVDGAITVRVLQSWADVIAIGPQWNALDELRDQECPFSSHEFALIWWQHFGTALCKPLVILVYQHERLMGIAPLYIRRRWPMLTVPTLHFIGQGEAEEDEVCAEYLDIIASPDDEGEVARAVTRTLIDSTGWGRFLVKDMLSDSLLSRHVIPELAASWSGIHVEETGFRYRVRLPTSWDLYLSGLKQNHRRKINLARRRLAEHDDVHFREITAESDLEEGMKVLAALHGTRWSQMGLRGSFSSQRFLSFHLDWARVLLEGRRLRLLTLYIAETPIASIYLIENAPSAFYYQSGADTIEWSRLSPGRLLLSLAIEEAIDKKLSWFDFMRGGDSSYKNSYGCEEDRMYKAAIFRPGPWGLIASLIFKARGFFRSQWRNWSVRYDR
ncbi:MAG: GNAT family N-acetyltransferase [Gammaproteobacteria bacterium]|nr:GNAT family N-acetyltransferase [Gammaproteobacteria bacterium]MBQ0775844.1 GNAT family N-acetyltransferase [Gammaproteobacteria bacterium]